MRTDILENKDFILECIEKNYPKTKICQLVNCKPTTLNYYLKKLDIEYNGNQGASGFKQFESKDCKAYFVNGLHVKSHEFKLKLIKQGYKNHECENCHGTSWLGKLIPIELHHIDGDKFNNLLENLQILCPNCHSLTPNYSGKKLKKSKKVTEKVVKEKKKQIRVHKKTNICFKCNINEIHKRSKLCVECFNLNQRKVERPSLETLLLDIQEFGYAATGRKYGVRDNTIRKWIK